MTNREKVAVKLRAKYKERTMPGFFEPQDVYFYTLNYLKDLEKCLPDGESAFTVLADLIDPTCSIYFVDTSTDTPDGYEQDGYYCCSHCHNELIGSFGYAWDDYQANDYKGESPFDYCPYCGARVVRGNHD